MFLLALIGLSCVLAPNVQLDNINQLEVTTPETVRIYLVRHGESAFNEPDPLTGIRMTSGKGLSIPLTECGQEQAIHLGKKLIVKTPNVNDIVVLSSTALRAQKTADHLFTPENRGDSFDGLCELGQGKWEGQPKDETYTLAMKKWEVLSAEDKYSFPKIETGESYSEVAKRALNDLEEIIKRYPSKTIFIVSHHATMNAIALELCLPSLSKEPESILPTIPFSNCDLLQIDLDTGNPIEESKVIRHIQSEV